MRAVPQQCLTERMSDSHHRPGRCRKCGQLVPPCNHALLLDQLIPGPPVLRYSRHLLPVRDEQTRLRTGTSCEPIMTPSAVHVTTDCAEVLLTAVCLVQSSGNMEFKRRSAIAGRCVTQGVIRPTCCAREMPAATRSMKMARVKIVFSR